MDSLPSEFDQRDVLPALGAMAAVMADSHPFSAGFLAALTARAVLRALIDNWALTRPARRGVSPDKPT